MDVIKKEDKLQNCFGADLEKESKEKKVVVKDVN